MLPREKAEAGRGKGKKTGSGNPKEPDAGFLYPGKPHGIFQYRIEINNQYAIYLFYNIKARLPDFSAA